MKKLLILAVLALFLASSISAQSVSGKLTGEQKNEFKSKMAAYKAELKLTAAQEPKFEEINLQYFETLATLKEDGSSKLKKYRKLKDATNVRNKKMKELLTAEQYQIFQQRQDEFKDELKKRRSKKS